VSDAISTEPRDDATICIVDPGGEDRANVPVIDADHSPGADPDAFDRTMAPVAGALLAAADLQSGESVLDIGCGCGATTLSAAAAVAPSGSVEGVDVTEEALDVARRRLEASPLTNVTLVLGDAQTDSFATTFDVAISKMGTMFFDDPVAAFANVRQALRAGGRMRLATWRPMDANHWLVIPGAALLRWITLPDLAEPGPGMFAQSDPDAVTAVLRNAGFTSIELEPVTVSLPLGADPDEALARLAGSGVGRAALDAVPKADLPAAMAAVRDALADYADASGAVRLDAGIWIVSAE